MKVIIVGNMGYVGPVLIKHFRKEYPGSFLSGFDIGYFAQNYTWNGAAADTLLNNQYYGDVRNMDAEVLKDYDVLVYLAAISNDPMGNVFEKPTLDINHLAAVEIAKKAKQMGVKKFVFASSCSVYGFADDSPRTESSKTEPLTAYAKSKVNAEIDLAQLADNNFEITCLRFATACGYSDRLRLDLVLNDFVASAIAAKRIDILSDGTPWRPLIHVADMARAIDWATQRTDGGSFLVINTGSNNWNYQVKDLAFAVQKAFGGNIEVNINAQAQPDKRSYKVSFDLYQKLAVGYQPQVDLPMAISGLKKGLEGISFNDANFRRSQLIRLNVIKKLMSEGLLNENLSIV